MRAATTGSSGTPSTRAKSLPRPAGTTASAPAVSRSAAASGRSRPSPPTETTVLPSRAGLGRQLAGVAGIQRLNGAEVGAQAAQLGLDLGQAAHGAPAGGRRIAEDQQPSDAGQFMAARGARSRRRRALDRVRPDFRRHGHDRAAQDLVGAAAQAAGDGAARGRGAQPPPRAPRGRDRLAARAARADGGEHDGHPPQPARVRGGRAALAPRSGTRDRRRRRRPRRDPRACCAPSCGRRERSRCTATGTPTSSRRCAPRTCTSTAALEPLEGLRAAATPG